MTYTAANMHQAIGQTVNVKFDHFQVAMRVIAAKTAYGVPRVQVTPVNGTGKAWIDVTRCSRIESAPTPTSKLND
jgi:hypothetical protein